MSEKIYSKNLFDLDKTIAKELFERHDYPWEVLPEISDFILEIGKSLPADKFDKIGDDIWVAKSAKVAETASLTGPLIIDEGAEIRHCAFIRGKAIIGKNSVFGNSCEIKNSIIFDDAQTPHYNYIGDSILGTHAHMGAGSITSNIKSDRTNIVIKESDNEKIETGLRKIGSIVGDSVEVGCGSILNPGSVIGPHTNVYPLSSVRGVVAGNSIYKSSSEIVEKY